MCLSLEVLKAYHTLSHEVISMASSVTVLCTRFGIKPQPVLFSELCLEMTGTLFCLTSLRPFCMMASSAVIITILICQSQGPHILCG